MDLSLIKAAVSDKYFFSPFLLKQVLNISVFQQWSLLQSVWSVTHVFPSRKEKREITLSTHEEAGPVCCDRAERKMHSCDDVETMEVTADCKIDRKLAKTMTTLTAALEGKRSLITNSSQDGSAAISVAVFHKLGLKKIYFSYKLDL